MRTMTQEDVAPGKEMIVLQNDLSIVTDVQPNSLMLHKNIFNASDLAI